MCIISPCRIHCSLEQKKCDLTGQSRRNYFISKQRQITLGEGTSNFSGQYCVCAFGKYLCRHNIYVYIINIYINSTFLNLKVQLNIRSGPALDETGVEVVLRSGSDKGSRKLLLCDLLSA